MRAVPERWNPSRNCDKTQATCWAFIGPLWDQLTVLFVVVRKQLPNTSDDNAKPALNSNRFNRPETKWQASSHFKSCIIWAGLFWILKPQTIKNSTLWWANWVGWPRMHESHIQMENGKDWNDNSYQNRRLSSAVLFSFRAGLCIVVTCVG